MTRSITPKMAEALRNIKRTGHTTGIRLVTLQGLFDRSMIQYGEGDRATVKGEGIIAYTVLTGRSIYC